MKRALNIYIAEDRLELINIDNDPQTAIKQVDSQLHVLELQSGRKIAFDWLLEADGANHPLANHFIQNAVLPVEYHETQNPVMHTTHAIANFKIAPEEVSAYQAYAARMMSINDRDRKKYLKILNKKGWNLQSIPEIRVFAVHDNFYIGVECPAGIQNNKKSQEEWVKTVLRLGLDKSVVNKLKLHKHASREQDISSIEIKLEEARQVVYRFPKTLNRSQNGKRESALLGLFGEAARKPHYHTASGAVTGFYHARAFGDYLKSPQKKKNRNAYTEEVEEIRSGNRGVINQYLERREQHENRFGRRVRQDANIREAIKRNAILTGNVARNVDSRENFQNNNFFARPAILRQDLDANWLDDFTTIRNIKKHGNDGQHTSLAYQDGNELHFYKFNIEKRGGLIIANNAIHCVMRIANGQITVLNPEIKPLHLKKLIAHRFGYNIYSVSTDKRKKNLRSWQDVFETFHAGEPSAEQLNQFSEMLARKADKADQPVRQARTGNITNMINVF